MDNLRKKILAWHDENARDLPWRGEKNPYAIWVSEIMLQQTRTETVIPYYLRFLAHYPDVWALAAAPEQALLKDWEGLGYYSRARNLQKAAQVICGQMNGQFPRDAKGLKALPGIGEYTAGAIASMAFDLPEPAIDGNQIRVIARLFAIEENTGLAVTRKAIRQKAVELLDKQRPGDFNQALMGMGALVCLPRKPRCQSCPAREECRARALGIEEKIPLLPEKIGQKVEKRAVALVFFKDKVLVRQRENKGLLAGLWEFPHFENAPTDKAVRAALEEMGVEVKSHRSGPAARHVFTHLIWEMKGHLYQAAGENCDGGIFVTARQLENLPMATAQKVYREEALSRL